MPLPKKSQTSRRESRAWELSLRGCTVREIAEILTAEGLPTAHSGAHAALKRVEARRRASLDADVTEHAGRQFAILRHLLGEAVQAWHASKPPSPPARPPAIPGPGDHAHPAPDPPPSRNQQGNAKYLAEARGALADLRKLLGLDAAEKLLLGGVSGADSIPLEVRDDLRDGLKALSLDELRDFHRLMSKMAGLPDEDEGPGDRPCGLLPGVVIDLND